MSDLVSCPSTMVLLREIICWIDPSSNGCGCVFGGNLFIHGMIKLGHQLSPDRGRETAEEKGRLIDVKFYQSYQPISWVIGVILVTGILFLTILYSIVVARILDLLILMEIA